MTGRITSRKNPLLQQARRLLTSRRERESAGLYAAEGTKLLSEAVRWHADLHTVILADGVEVALPEDIPVVRVPEDVMASLSEMPTPQGALFLCRIPTQVEFQPRPGMLLLDGLQDPGNLGTILRTADALDVPVALLEGCADPYNPKTVRASMGAMFRTPPAQTGWDAARQAFRQAGIPMAAAALTERARDLRQADLGSMAVIVGSEGQGIRREILADVDEALIIPMNPRCESLNAAIAAAIIMWQMK